MRPGGALFAALSIIAILIGASFYMHQFSTTSPLLWAFLPDCPMYVFIALAVFLFRVQSKTVQFLAAVGMAKYGLWTLFIFWSFPEIYFAPIIINSTLILIAGHILMVVGGMVFIPKKMDAKTLAVVLAWFLAMDGMDYVVGTVPIIPAGKEMQVALFALAETIFISIGFYSVKVFRDNPAANAARGFMGW